MNAASILFAALALAPVLDAQQVAVSLSSPGPLTMSSVGGGAMTNWQQPGGSLPNFGYFAPPLAGDANGTLSWSLQASNTIGAFHLQQQITVPEGSAGSVGENEFLFEVTASSTVAARLELQSLALASAGLATPTITVDVGDDGTIDFTQADVFAGIDLTLDANPLALRIRMENVVASEGDSSAQLFASVTPRNDVTIQPAAIGCTGASPDMFCDPSFVATGVEFVRQPTFTLPAVVVLGLSVQPMLLPVSTPLEPCLLLPQPDAVITLLGNSHTVSIPSSVRPVTFWGQGVAVDQDGTLLAMDGYRIVAQ